MPRAPLPREKSLLLPEIQNPFVHRLDMTWPQKLQIALMTVTLFPLRLMIIAVMLITGWTLANICMMGRSKEDEKEPMEGWRKWLRPAVVFFCRAVFFFGGFHWVTVKGQRASPEEAQILATAPHSSFFDACPISFLDLTSVVAKSAVEFVPIFGTLTRFTQPVFVSREDPNSRQNTIKEIQRRAQSGGKWPQIVIFPEGTCTNRTCLISFKPGAFYPGVPVQPVLIKYKNKLDTVTWTWEGPGAIEVLWYTLCQWNNPCEIEFMPVYHPSEEEKKDARLYASNVRKIMAEQLGIPVTDHTFEDIRLMKYAAKLDLPAATGLVEFQKLSKKLRMNFDNMKELLENFCIMAQKDKGSLTIEQFAEHLSLPVSEPLKEMFELYDRDNSGTIDFREYVIGMSLVARPANCEETLQLAFKLFDHGGKGFITQQELEDILTNAFGMDGLETDRLFSQADADEDGKITYAEFKAYAAEMPEYAKLFQTYQELNEGREARTLVEELNCTDITPEEYATENHNSTPASKVKAE